MSMAINMPLGGLINKSLKGEARFAHEEWLRTYVKRLTNGNKTKLKQALNEVDEAINQWRDASSYPLMMKSYQPSDKAN
jgi:hypothetical protein